MTTLYIQADSRLLNPTLSEQLIAAAYEDDAEAAQSEYGGLFRSDISAYLSDAVIDSVLAPGIKSRPRELGYQYTAFIDPAGGVEGGDAMTLGISHQIAGGRVVLDRLVAIDPPFKTEEVVAEFALTMSAYALSKAKGDRYGGLWPAQALMRHGITYVPSEQDKSTIYNEAAVLFTNGLVELLDDARMVTELRLLERRPRAGGKVDGIDHAPGRASHDDRINAVAGSLLMASKLAWTGRAINEPARGHHVNGLSYDPFELDQQRTRQQVAMPLHDGWGRPV